MAVAGEQANAVFLPMDGKPIAVVFDFVNPIWARRGVDGSAEAR